MKFAALGESAILLETGILPEQAAPLVRQWVQALEGRVLEGVLEVVPSFTTIAVFFDAAKLAREHRGSPYATVCHWIESRLTLPPVADIKEPRQFVVPVCYGGEYGADLEEVARATNLTTDAVVLLHSKGTYEVRAIGFSPGFPYLAGLPDELQVPRRATPRTKVPAGSVGIGGAQTGIYSLPTPGGWNLIGRTPWALFNPAAEAPCLFRIGDHVRFDPIPADRMAELLKKPLNQGPLKIRGDATGGRTRR